MKEQFFSEKVIPNISGLPIKISNGHNKLYAEKGQLICGFHIHSEIELLYIYSGHFGTKLADGSEYTANAGDVVCINSNVVHSTFAASAGNIENRLIQFKADSFLKSRHSYDAYLEVIRGTRGKQIEIFRNGDINRYCEFLFSHANDGDTSGMLYLTSGIYGIIASLYQSKFLIDESEDIDRKKAKKLIDALEFISKNYKESISLSDVCATVKMSNYYFCRLFKSAINMGFTDYLNAVRIHHAEEMLCDTDKSILDIAFENGFSSISYFNRVFKSIKHCSPSEYRKFCKEAVKISTE